MRIAYTVSFPGAQALLAAPSGLVAASSRDASPALPSFVAPSLVLLSAPPSAPPYVPDEELDDDELEEDDELDVARPDAPLELPSPIASSVDTGAVAHAITTNIGSAIQRRNWRVFIDSLRYSNCERSHGRFAGKISFTAALT
jgi:hypothetical protein